MNLTKLWVSVTLAVLFPLMLLASDHKVAPKGKAPGKLAPLTSRQLDVEMLDSARVMLAHAPATLRAQACYQSAVGYGLVDRARELKMLKQCFRQTQALEDKDVELKTDLQLRILDALYTGDPAATEALLPSAEPRARINVQSRILQRLVDSKKYDDALALVTQLSYSADFPYRAAAGLMVHLPAERDLDRRLIFMAALKSYRLQDPDTDPGIEDMATLVIRFWRHLDPKLTMQAIDEILDHAREDLKNENARSLTIGTGLGEAQFSTSYQYRLFELVPVIQQLDPSMAESILNDNPRLAAVLNDYPQGLPSLEPTFRDSPLKPGEFPRFTITHHLHAATSHTSDGLLRDRIDRESRDISSGAANDPKEAIQKAAQLPDLGVENGRSPRADALAQIATMTVRRHPDIAEDALKQLLKAAAGYPPLAQSFYFLKAANIYFFMNNKAEASRMVEKAASVASKLYQRDSRTGDSNQAFKFDWPSTAVWRACLVLQNKIDPSLNPGLLKQVDDPEIRASVQITLANLRLGGPLPANTVRQQFGDGPGSVQSFPLMR